MSPAAMNLLQYSRTCGAAEFTTVPSNLRRCLIIQGSDEGSGSNPITGEICALVVDKCPEFEEGDVYRAISCDGRWKVSWAFSACPIRGVLYTIRYKLRAEIPVTLRCSHAE
jgi:hypothetical protein